MGNLSKSDIERNFKLLQANIQEVLKRSGRDKNAVRIMAVTKGFPLSFVDFSLKAGIILFGENRVLEADQKYSHLLGQIELHLIGHLQRNKAKRAVGLFNCIQSIDKVETAQELARHALAQGVKMDILIQVNTALEETKSGYTDTDKLYRDVEIIKDLPELRICGLMTIAPFTREEKRLHACFAGLKSLFADIRNRFSLPDFTTLSMGMSNDYKIAVEEGATLVRIGTALYGAGRGYDE